MSNPGGGKDMRKYEKVRRMCRWSIHKKPRVGEKIPNYVLRCTDSCSVKVGPQAWIGYPYQSHSEQKQRYHHFSPDVPPQAVINSA